MPFFCGCSFRQVDDCPSSFPTHDFVDAHFVQVDDCPLGLSTCLLWMPVSSGRWISRLTPNFLGFAARVVRLLMYWVSWLNLASLIARGCVSGQKIGCHYACLLPKFNWLIGIISHSYSVRSKSKRNRKDQRIDNTYANKLYPPRSAVITNRFSTAILIVYKDIS